jgi:hypothetical protein
MLTVIGDFSFGFRVFGQSSPWRDAHSGPIETIHKPEQGRCPPVHLSRLGRVRMRFPASSTSVRFNSCSLPVQRRRSTQRLRKGTTLSSLHHQTLHAFIVV